MKQSEIEFFWPLTEQIQLDLDYTNCEKPRIYTSLPLTGTGVTTYASFNSNAYMSITASSLSIDVETTTFKVTEEPPWYRKLLYKLLDIQWEKK
jgi:hypothetical protein